MKTLWFKAQFVPDILTGAKIDTIRTPSSRLPRAGEEVAFSVGPRAPFARAIILAVESVAAIASEARRAQVISCYGEVPAEAVRLIFRLTDKLEGGGQSAHAGAPTSTTAKARRRHV